MKSCKLKGCVTVTVYVGRLVQSLMGLDSYLQTCEWSSVIV